MDTKNRKRRVAVSDEAIRQFKSKLEKRVSDQLPIVVYEQDKIKYIVPESRHVYTPDFRIGVNKYIEVKGWLLPDERKKHLLIKEQHPEIEIKFFFENANKKINKGSKTTYADWCAKHGFEYTDLRTGIPKEWYV